MAIQAGTRLGPYEVEAPIGAGGMGEVYRARDTRLERTVALKILPAALAQDAQLRQRFEREARAISALNHPHICTLHDVGSSDGVDYLVMEHLEGESLQQRLEKGPLPVAQVLRLGVEIADALERAHRAGIVHRDLKPANVMLTKGGAKLLDFGLAKTELAAGAAPAGAAFGGTTLAGTGLATAAKPLTEEGTILGTFQYMAPEQLEGGTVDARTDVFALGALLHEMVTGRPAFSGKSRASLIAAILATDPPSISAVQPLSPPALDRLIRLCLAKDPEERWQTAHDVKLELQGIAEGASVTGAAASGSPARRRWRRLAIAGWSAAALALVAAGNLGWRAAHPPPRVGRFEIAPPPQRSFNPADAPVLVSPDGHSLLAGLQQTAEQHGAIVLRPLDSYEAREITTHGYDPFWAPDGRQIGIFSLGKLLRLDVDGGSARFVAKVGDSRGGAWAPDGTIVYAPESGGPLWKVGVAGGQPTPATRLDASRKEIGHWRPFFLPDGRHFLYTALSAERELAAVWVGSLDSLERTRVLDLMTTVVYSDGYLLYVDGSDLYAQPFDNGRLEKRGDAVLVAKGVALNTFFGAAGYSAATGVLAYHPQPDQARPSIVRLDVRSGARASMPNMPGANLDVSRDDRRLAAQEYDPVARGTDIWVYDLERGTRTRISFDPASDYGPVWSPDSRSVVYASYRGDRIEVLRRLASGAGSEETVTEITPEAARHQAIVGLEVVDWSRDGRYLLAELDTVANRRDLVTLDLTTTNPQPRPLLATPFNELSARFSPDGHWFAYVSDESGKSEVYVQSFPPGGGKWQISNGGGDSPRWSGDSRRLFYLATGSDAASEEARLSALRSRGNPLMAVDLAAAGGELKIGMPRQVASDVGLDLALTSDGGTVFVSQTQSAATPPIRVVLDWTAGLQR